MNKKEQSKKYYQEHKKEFREYYQQNKEKKRQYKKEYYQKNKEKIIEYYEKNKESIKKSKKEWREENKEKQNAYQRKSKRKYPKKVKAGIEARNKIPIPKGQLCEMCFHQFATERHHWNYDYPLEIKFLDAKCHTLLEKWKRRQNQQSKWK